MYCLQVAGYHVAYVGNLDFDATDIEVQQIFPDCNVTKVRLHTDRHTGKSRGFAHVHFLDEESLDRLVICNLIACVVIDKSCCGLVLFTCGINNCTYLQILASHHGMCLCTSCWATWLDRTCRGC